MIRPLALLAVANCCIAHAQLCTTTANPMPAGQDHNLVDGVLHPDGGGLTLALFNTPTGPIATRWAADGQVAWNSNFQHMDPSNWAYPVNVSPVPGGGAVINGRFMPQQASYTNMYAAELGPDGTPVWARFYMLDSVAVMSPTPRGLIRTPDGGWLFPIWTAQGLSLSKLDGTAVPVWTRRYRASMGFNGMQAFVEANGEITLVGWKVGTSTFMARLDAEGTVLWKRSWAHHWLPAARAMNGDVLLLSETYGSLWHLARMDAQGQLLWHRTYPYPHMDAWFNGGVRELANGHLLLLGELGALIETDASGAALGARTVGGYGLSGRLLGAEQPNGDTLMIAGDVYSGSSAWTGMLTASSPADLGCAGGPSTTSSTALSLPAEITDDTLMVVRDSLKTWTMLFDPASPALVLDPQAFVNAGRARPGFDHRAYGVITNNSLHTTGPITATLTVAPELTYLGAVPVPQQVSGQTITWQLPAMGPNGQRILAVDLSTPPDPQLLGTAIPYTFSFTQDSAEVSLVNNTSTVTYSIVGAYDPNIMEVSPSPYFHLLNDTVLNYTIHFQNTGSAEATNVVVRDTLPAALDLSTFELGTRSHPCTYSLSGNGLLTFTFTNINLPDSTSDEPGSHGHVSFRIKPGPGLFVGQQITDQADIFFDFNPPIRTPDATVIVTDVAMLQPDGTDADLRVFPVPTSSELTIALSNGIAASVAWAVSVDGRRIPLSLRAEGDGVLRAPVHHLAAGAYVLVLMDRHGRRWSARFVME
ncbi:MAG: DUF11 domain-containing protein [Flavobacteriales bacterium]|nr:DUF11 domain-containing protein [Flavobacteriales bacterium]